MALFVLWGFIELRVTDPMVDMRMMARRVVLFTNLTAMLSGFALYMTWVILPTFYELPSGLPDPLASIADYGFGTSVTVAGLWILPTSLLVLVAGPLGGLHGAPLRRARAAGDGDAPGGARRRPASPPGTPKPGSRRSPSSSAGSASGSPSPSCRS